MISDSKLVIHAGLNILLLAVVFIHWNYGQINEFRFHGCCDLVHCLNWTFSNLCVWYIGYF